MHWSSGHARTKMSVISTFTVSKLELPCSSTLFCSQVDKKQLDLEKLKKDILVSVLTSILCVSYEKQEVLVHYNTKTKVFIKRLET